MRDNALWIADCFFGEGYEQTDQINMLVTVWKSAERESPGGWHGTEQLEQSKTAMNVKQRVACSRC